MWILDCEGDALKGKRLWLRPGKRFIFGRTKTEDGGVVVVDKTISRKHLDVRVDDVQPSDCANAGSRTRLTLIDGCGDPKGTKIGTLLNGEQIRAKTVVLDQDENAVSLGKYKHHFRFTWVPITFTFSFTTKEQRANPYLALRERLGPLDIKVLDKYERRFITHVVARKRNTSKGLQALINGKYIVHNNSFVEAVVAAATPGENGPAPLEEDFEANFPDPLKFLPPQGEEPTQRSAEAYSPNPDRLEMFDGYTFVFYNQQQFDNLLAPITDGRGKALLRQAIPNDTTVDDFVRYVKGVAGEKGLGNFEDGSEGKGVVVVRFNPVKGADTEWYAEFGRQVSLYLDHRLIEQNEFLDAILGNDASVLRRPLLDEPSGVIAPPPTAATVMDTQTIQGSAAPAATPVEVAPPAEPSRRGRRRAGRTQFVGFEDDFSGPVASSMPESESMQVDDPPVESQGLFVTQNPDLEISQMPEPEARTSRKRPASPVIEEEEDILEEMAPTAAAMKRRRLANNEDRRRRGASSPPPPAPAPVVKEEQHISKSKAKRTKRDIKKEEESDPFEIERRQREEREKAEALAQAEREAMQAQYDSKAIEQIRNLTIIETMEVKRSDRPTQRTLRADQSERWEQQWNCKKDFKKFRRRKDANNARGFDKVIVPLEEAKKKDFGIGDTYWEKNDTQRKKTGKGKGRDTQDVSQMESLSRPTNRAPEVARRILASSEAEDGFDEAIGPADVISDSEPEVVGPNLKGRSSRASQKLADKTSTSQNLPTSNKRAAASTLTKPAPAKKARQTTIRKEPEPDSDDSSDDGLKFRFKKKA